SPRPAQPTLGGQGGTSRLPSKSSLWGCQALQIDVFSEIQDPRPWEADHEHRRIVQTLELARLADELGYGCWWQVEHHGGEEFSLSSAPELLLTAISQQTSRIRVRHSAVLAPHRFNHPIRLAER